VVNLLQGDGEGIGAPLSRHPGIDKLSFTGSNLVDEAVMRAAAQGVRPVSLELGGKSPILVTEDADLELARDLVIAGIYYNAGQMCSANSLIMDIYSRKIVVWKIHEAESGELAKKLID